MSDYPRSSTAANPEEVAWRLFGTTVPLPIEVPIVVDPGVEIPAYATSGAAGVDVRSRISLTLAPGERAMVPTGIRIAVPEGYEAQVRPRSGLAIKHGISMVNSPGTIDSDYRGEVQVLLINHGQESFTIEPGDRIAQLVFCPVASATFFEYEDLQATDRGEGGFGSTGKR